MTKSKKLFLLLIALLFVSAVEGQSVKVKEESKTLRGESLAGFSVDLEGTQQDVMKSMTSYLRSFGKLKSGEIMTVSEPVLDGFAPGVPLTATTTANGGTTSAWIGFNPASTNPEQREKISRAVERLVYDLGVQFYRDKVQVRIDESLRAVQAVEKQQQRLVNENKFLNSKLESNKREKIQLEKSIENNKLEYADLLKRLELNKKSQDSVAVAAEQIRKMVETHRERQKKIN